MDAPARLALDIETVSPDVPAGTRPNFRDSSQFELLAVCAAFQPEPGADIDHRVFVRDGWGPAAELAVAERAVDWLTDRDADALLTYNGDAFDLPHLVGRTRLATAALASDSSSPAALDSAVLAALDSLLASLPSDDLKRDAWDAFGEYTSFEDACAAVDVAVPKTALADYEVSHVDLSPNRRASERETPHVLSADLPILGEHYLDLADAGATDTKTFRDLRSLLDDYVAADVLPLYELADRRPFVAATT
ncbi:hypothetical protein ACNS7O_07275 [Haloferacaceae archaeon DSL9]